MRADGYHEVITILHALDLHDVVSVSPSQSLAVRCEPGVGVASDSNTAYKAAVAYASRVGRNPGVAIEIEKRIPHAAGLGGGSADAAAVIAALATLWELDPAGQEALAAAAEVGADVPFFLAGGPALFDRRGDRMVRRLPPLACDVVLVNPGVAASTGSVYQLFDSLPRLAAPGPRHVADALRLSAGDPVAVAPHIFNSLGPAAQAAVPAIAPVREWLAAQPGVLTTEVAGSGATVFALTQDAEVAFSLAADAEARGWWSLATRSWPSGVVEMGGEPR